MGALLAAGFYKFLMYMNEGDLGKANPGQDSAAGEFDAPIEQKRVNSQEMDEQVNSNQSQGNNRGSGAYGQQQPQYAQQPYGQSPAMGPNPSGWGQNVMSEMDRRSQDVNHRRQPV